MQYRISHDVRSQGNVKIHIKKFIPYVLSVIFPMNTSFDPKPYVLTYSMEQSPSWETNWFGS